MKSLSKTPLVLAAMFAAASPTVAQPAKQVPLTVTLRLSPLPGTESMPGDALDRTLMVLRNRVNAMGIDAPIIRANGPDHIVIQLVDAQSTTPAQQRALIAKIVQPGKLEFIWLKDARTKDGVGNRKGRYVYEGENRVRDSRTRRLLTPARIRARVLYADPKCTVVTGADLKPGGAKVDIQAGRSGNAVVVMLRFNEAGTRKIANFTALRSGVLLGIVVDGKITQAPRIHGPITDGIAVIKDGGLRVQGAQELANVLNAGSLPVTLTVERVQPARGALRGRPQ